MSFETFPSQEAPQPSQEKTLAELEAAVTAAISERTAHPDDPRAAEALKEAWERFAGARKRHESDPAA